LPGYPKTGFSAVVPVVNHQTYRVSVRARGPGDFWNAPWGDPSAEVSFKWTDLDSTGNGDPVTGAPRNPNDDGAGGGGGSGGGSGSGSETLPWPARPLPPMMAIDGRFHLKQKLAPDSLVLTDDRFGPMIRIGVAPDFLLNPLPKTIVETANGALTSQVGHAFDPRLILYRFTGRGVLPCVLYRRQADSADAVPRVPDGQKRDWIQVTPMLEDIAFEPAGAANEGKTIIHDPWFAMPEPATNDQPAELFLVDRQPVVRGHAYQYALVLFSNVSKEPEATLPLGTITIK
jgi:hypothetical protein